MAKILAIETSCDDTSAAIIHNGSVLSNVISSQEIHNKYSGIVPELASRAHIKIISQIVSNAIDAAGCKIIDVDAIAVTSEPGLIGSLIVGSNFAKGLSLKFDKPIIPVNHIEGHIYSACLENPDFQFPFISLVVSGGHTAIFMVNSYTDYKIVGLTRDDAAGEAFDKTASLLGLPYPGGPHIDELAKQGDPAAYNFPRSMINDKSYDFSFSGLKTAVRYFLIKQFPNGVPDDKMADICASVQAAIVDVLIHKTLSASKENRIRNISVAGGVSANSSLRMKFAGECKRRKLQLSIPDIAYSMDNAAMIGFLAEKKFSNTDVEKFSDLTFTVSSSALRAPRKKKKRN